MSMTPDTAEQWEPFVQLNDVAATPNSRVYRYVLSYL